MLRTETVSVYLGQVEVIRRLSMEIDDREIVAIIGPNSAGKTTLLKAISGLIPIKAGRIIFNGRRIDNTAPEKIVELGISHVPEGRQIFTALTVEENLILGAYTRFKRREKESIGNDIESVYGIFPVLKEKKRKPAETLSGGEQAMLAIGRSLMLNPKLLLIDEVSLGLAPLLVDEIYRKIIELNSNGMGILLIEQNYYLALSVAKKVYILERGEVKRFGSAHELEENENITDYYLGRRKMSVRERDGS